MATINLGTVVTIDPSKRDEFEEWRAMLSPVDQQRLAVTEKAGQSFVTANAPHYEYIRANFYKAD
ncbi:hypothetical protein ASD89_17600 [Caulobacter sp. Root656]|nr:hypothetical protein ASD89_17600 [Caulobacter sp. Root656]